MKYLLLTPFFLVSIICAIPDKTQHTAAEVEPVCTETLAVTDSLGVSPATAYACISLKAE